LSSELEAKRWGDLDLFLEGCERVRALSTAERDAVALTPAIRHVVLMGHVLRHTRTYQRDHWAHDGFFDWSMSRFRWWADRV